MDPGGPPGGPRQLRTVCRLFRAGPADRCQLLLGAGRLAPLEGGRQPRPRNLGAQQRRCLDLESWVGRALDGTALRAGRLVQPRGVSTQPFVDQRADRLVRRADQHRLECLQKHPPKRHHLSRRHPGPAGACPLDCAAGAVRQPPAGQLSLGAGGGGRRWLPLGMVHSLAALRPAYRTRRVAAHANGSHPLCRLGISGDRQRARRHRHHRPAAGPGTGRSLRAGLDPDLQPAAHPCLRLRRDGSGAGAGPPPTEH